MSMAALHLLKLIWMHQRLETQIHFDVETLGEMLSPIILSMYLICLYGVKRLVIDTMTFNLNFDQQCLFNYLVK